MRAVCQCAGRTFKLDPECREIERNIARCTAFSEEKRSSGSVAPSRAAKQDLILVKIESVYASRYDDLNRLKKLQELGKKQMAPGT
jgi:hypothetical protein